MATTNLYSGSIGMNIENQNIFMCLFEKQDNASLLASDNRYYAYGPGDKVTVFILEDEPISVKTIFLKRYSKNIFDSEKKYWKVFAADSFGHRGVGYLDETLLETKFRFNSIHLLGTESIGDGKNI